MKAVNLLPSDRGSVATAATSAKSGAPSGSSPFGAYVILGALAFAVVAMAAYVLTNNTIKDRTAELARVTQEAEATKAKAGSLQPFADFAQLASQRISTVQGLAGSRFDWDRTLRDLSRALPSDTHLRTLKGSVSTTITGGSSSSLRGAISSPAIELTGCTANQSTVAKLMSRLRAIRGVTRVSLSKADKGTLSVGADAAPVVGLTSSEERLCKSKRAPSFELVIFFERANVAPSAVPNMTSAPAGVTATPGTVAPATPGAPAAGTAPVAPADAASAPAGTSGGTTAPAAPSTTQGVSSP